MNWHELGIARGAVPGHSYVHKFGFNSAVSSTKETIWAQGGMANWMAAASALKISSSATADDPASTGAWTATIQGLDGSWDWVSEDVTLDGQAQVTTTTEFLRPNRMIVNTAGTGGTNAGVLYAYTGTEASGVPSDLTKVYTTIGIGDGQTLQAFYTVPDGYDAYLARVMGSTFGNTSVSITMNLEARANADQAGACFVTKERFLLSRNGIVLDFRDSLPSFGPRTDLMVTGESSGADGDASATFDLILVQR